MKECAGRLVFLAGPGADSRRREKTVCDFSVALVAMYSAICTGSKGEALQLPVAATASCPRSTRRSRCVHLRSQGHVACGWAGFDSALCLYCPRIAPCWSGEESWGGCSRCYRCQELQTRAMWTPGLLGVSLHARQLPLVEILTVTELLYCCNGMRRNGRMVNQRALVTTSVVPACNSSLGRLSQEMGLDSDRGPDSTDGSDSSSDSSRDSSSDSSSGSSGSSNSSSSSCCSGKSGGGGRDECTHGMEAATFLEISRSKCLCKPGSVLLLTDLARLCWERVSV